QRIEGAAGRYDGVVEDAVIGAQLGQLVGHAGAAGDAVDQSFGAFQHTVEDLLGRGHLPQDVHMDAAVAVGPLIGDLGLGDAAADGVGDQFLMPLPAGAAVIMLRDRIPVFVVGIG